MHASILSRSVMAVASLAIGSVALAAVPADAATKTGITRAQVLTAAAGARTAPDTSRTFIGNYDPATNRALRAMVNRTCAVDPDGPEVYNGVIVTATAPGASADGVVVSALLYDTDTLSQQAVPTGRLCSFGALTTTKPRSVLRGAARLGEAPSVRLSGDVFVTRPVSSPLDESTQSLPFPAFSATGTSVQSTKVKVSDKKTTKEKKAARTAYDKRLKAVKKSYAKALDKAGSSKSKRAAAKKAWGAKKKSAKAKYRYAIAGFKIVTRKTATPFTVSAQSVLPPPNQP
jgi:hypothetical protein